jgi:MFS family permease
MWLVLHLTDSGLAVGVTSALQFTPILLFGAYGGLLADRFPKRRLLMITQVLMALPALALWALTSSGSIELWMVFALVFARGMVNAVDNPTRQSFVIEMVGADRVVNAVSLNSVIVHCARIAGPAGAGVVIAFWGVDPCFLLNALSFTVMIGALARMRTSELTPAPRSKREPGALRAAVRYVLRTPELAIPLGLMAAVGTLTLNFQVVLPLLARFTFHADASTYSTLVAAMGTGAVVGALVTGARRHITPHLMVSASAALGALTLLVASAPTLPLTIAALVPLGAAAVTFAAGINSSLQINVEPAMRGRVMALYSVVFLGSTPIGGPLLGWIAQATDPRASLALGGAAALLAGLLARSAFARAGLAATPR